GENQIKRLGVRLNQLQRGLAVGSLLNPKVFGLECAAEDPAHGRLVVHYQNACPLPVRALGIQPTLRGHIKLP
ncbi:MAG: hypothetical protein QOH59_1477, partial [Gemmatimonadales bacterium]|nr:hypothetical protein [Gemmatimonadales bacterium]